MRLSTIDFKARTLTAVPNTFLIQFRNINGDNNGHGRGGGRGRFVAAGTTGKPKIKKFSEIPKTEKSSKNIEKNDTNRQKRRFWRSYAKTDVTIEFYAKNYPI